MTASHAPESRPLYHWAFVLLLLLTVIVYYPGLSGDYMFDDTSNLLQNQALNIQTLDLDSLSEAAQSSGAGLLRRPVSMASFALNRFFFGIDPYSHKVVNLAIHLLTGCLLYFLTRQLLQVFRTYREPRLSAQAAGWIPVIVCGLWLVHPLNLTSVLYIVQRMTSLSALFTVAGLCLYVVGRRRMLTGLPGLGIILTSLFLFGGLAVFSKENGILLPLYMLVIEFTVFRFQDAGGRRDRSVVTLFIFIVAVPALLASIYLLTHIDTLLNYSHRDFSLQERVMTQARVLLFYLEMILTPSVQALGLYHDDMPLSHGLLAPPSTLLAMLVLTALLVTGLLVRTLRPLVSLGILWFFAGHLLESTILPLELVHEHRNYLADYGILLAITCAIAQANLPKLSRWINVPVPLLVLALFAYTTWLRSGQWSDNVTHAIYEALNHPESPRAVFSAGRIHARLALDGHMESRPEAFRYLESSMQLDTTGIMSNVTLIKLSYLLDEPEDPAWFDDMIDKLERYPISAADIASIQVLTDCTQEICRIEPERMERLFGLILLTRDAKLVSAYGYYTINTRGNFDKGLALFEEAIELNPREPQYRKNLINLLLYMQRLDEAEMRLAEFSRADTHGNSEHFIRTAESEIKALRSGTIPSGTSEGSPAQP